MPLVRRDILLMVAWWPVVTFGQAATNEASNESLDAGVVASTADTANQLTDMSLEELMTVHVTTLASATPHPVSEAASNVTVITADEIAAMGANTVEEALESVPGLHLSNTATHLSKFVFRGVSTTYTSQVLLMVNGVPITTVQRGIPAAPSYVPIEMVERIEVLRGPGSAVWGADAMTGVINVVTKSAAEFNGTTAGARGGSFGTISGWAMHGETVSDFKALVAARALTTDGPKNVIEEDALRGTPLTRSPGTLNLSQASVDLLLDVQRGPWRLRGSHLTMWNVGTGDGIVSVLDPNGRLAFGRSILDLTYDQKDLLPNVDVFARVAYFTERQQIDRDLILFPPGIDLGSGPFPNGMIGNPAYTEHRIQVDAAAIYHGFSGHHERLAVGYSLGQIFDIHESKNFTSTFAPLPYVVDVSNTPDSYLPSLDRHNVSAVLQEEWAISPDWELTAGARYDYHSDFGHSINPRLAILWRASSQWTARLFYGRAFRAPTFAELATRNNPFAIGNTHLKPETGDFFEGNLAFQPTHSLRFAVTPFYYTLNELISFVPDAGRPTITAQNADNLQGVGGEFEASLRLVATLDAVVNYSFQRSWLGTTGAVAPDAPQHKLYGRIDWRFLADWLFSPQVVWVGPRPRQANDPRPDLHGYVSIDLVLRRSHLFGFDIAAVVKNLLDYDIREPTAGPAIGSTFVNVPHDFPQPGRAFFVQASYSL